jgi:hypothetical protein
MSVYLSRLNRIAVGLLLVITVECSGQSAPHQSVRRHFHARGK